MTIETLQSLRESAQAESLSYSEIADIEAAFAKIPDDQLRDERENATADDMLDELETFTVLTDEHVEYLNDLRDSGETNMFGAGRYVQEEFGVDRQEAKKIVSQWMAQF